MGFCRKFIKIIEYNLKKYLLSDKISGVCLKLSKIRIGSWLEYKLAVLLLSVSGIVLLLS